MVESTEQLIKAFREGGQVKRFHTVPIVGEQTVGAHSYNVLSLLLVLCENPSIQLIKAVLWHDVAERWLGDVPPPAKWASRDFNDTYSRLERKLNKRLGLPELSQVEENWLNAVDKIELLLFCDEQIEGFGNNNLKDTRGRVLHWIGEAIDNNRFPERCLNWYITRSNGRTQWDISTT